jgi:hypothetical protein
MSNGDETDSFKVRLGFNANDASFAASLRVPGSLRSLLRKLPEGAASVLSWLPDITLDAVGVDFTTERPLTFGVFAKAGIAGSADPAGQAFFASVADAQNKTAFAAGLAITTPVDFSAVPVLGTLMDGILLDDLAVVYASADLKKNAFHLPPPAPVEIPAYKKGISLVLTLESGGTKQSFALAPKSKPQSKPLTGAVQPLAADDELPPMAWFDVQKSIGPLTFGRIGMSSSEEWLALGLDASLALAGLTISLTGFTAGFPKDDISLSGLSLSLEALGIVFSRGGVLILGNLVRQERAGIRSYDGALLIQTGAYGIAAIGSFAQVEGRYRCSCSAQLRVFLVARQPSSLPALPRASAITIRWCCPRRRR